MKNLLDISPGSDKRVFGLDFIRMLAILYVMLLHAGNFVPKVLLPAYKSLFYDGVGIFFVLSGFLIGGILIRQIENYRFNFKSLLSFWVKRWSRTLPNYYLFLTVLLAVEFLRNPHFQLGNYLQYFVFCQNLITDTPYFFTHSWSLSVEEWFYLIIPILLFLLVSLLKLALKYAFPVVILSIIISITLLRYNQIEDIHSYEMFENIVYSVLYRFDSLMYGMAGAYLAHYFSAFWNKIRIPAFSIGIALFALYYCVKIETYYERNFVFTLTSLTVFFVLPYMNSLKKIKCSKISRPITYISLISYSLYLVNLIVVKELETLINWEYIRNFASSQFSISISWSLVLFINFILSWVISFALAAIIYKYFEVPTTSYLRKKINIRLEKKTVHSYL